MPRSDKVSLSLSPFRAFVEKWRECTACHLHECRKKVVLCRGTYPCDVVFLGEAPGHSEDVIGKPFCGPAGHLMDHIIRNSVPSNVTYALTNLVACIPLDEDGKKVQEPDDRAVRACSHRLIEFVKICNPQLIVCVGKLAYDWVEPGYHGGIKFHERIPLVKITHPAAMLRQNVAIQGLTVQKAVIAVRNSVEEHVKVH